APLHRSIAGPVRTVTSQAPRPPFWRNRPEGEKGRSTVGEGRGVRTVSEPSKGLVHDRGRFEAILGRGPAISRDDAGPLVAEGRIERLRLVAGARVQRDQAPAQPAGEPLELRHQGPCDTPATEIRVH